MKVERIRDLENLEKRRDIWNELLFSSEQNCIFLTHEWISSWWKCFSGESSLESLIFKDEKGNPVGICPFMIRDECLCFIASQEVSDYCDIITIEERREEFYEHLLKFIRENYSGIKKIELMNIRHSSPTLKFLPQLAPRYKYSCSLIETEVAPLLELPSSYEDYKRLGHLEYQPMIGGDRCAKYPARMVASIILNAVGLDEAIKILKKLGIEEDLEYKDTEMQTIISQFKNSRRKFPSQNIPLTSSTGRIYDSISYLLGASKIKTYRGEPAMRLESMARKGNPNNVELNIKFNKKSI